MKYRDNALLWAKIHVLLLACRFVVNLRLQDLGETGDSRFPGF